MPAMTMRRLLPLAALIAALALAACGGSGQPSAADAQSAYGPVRTQIVALGGSIGDAMSNASRQTDVALATTFAALVVRGHAAVARLDELDVPSDLVAERNALRDAIEQGTGDLSDIATAARAHDAAAARTAASQLVTDSEQIKQARDAFEKALDRAAQ